MASICNPLSGNKIEMKIVFLLTLLLIPASMRVSSMPAIRVGGPELSEKHPAWGLAFRSFWNYILLQNNQYWPILHLLHSFRFAGPCWLVWLPQFQNHPICCPHSAASRMVCFWPDDDHNLSWVVFVFYVSCKWTWTVLEWMPRRPIVILSFVEKRLLLHVICWWL